MKTILLDTNAVSAFFRGDQRVLTMVAEAQHVYLSTIVMGELLAGFQLGTQAARNRALLDKLLACSTVAPLPLTTETADYYSRLFVALRKAGRPIPTNDLWIAAHTMECGAVLITFDQHFHDVPGLRVAP
jgi:tRNA(fMet)-specific endonuclease VapC